MRHNTCGNEWEVLPNNFTCHKQRCPICQEEVKVQNLRRTHEEFLKIFDLNYSNEYLLLGKYTTEKAYIKIKHIACNSEYMVVAQSLIKGVACKKCSDKERGIRTRKSHDVFLKQVDELGEGEYQVKTAYNGGHNYITIFHHVCNHEYQVTPSNFINGHRCPNCNVSKGEKMISDYLSEKGIQFDREYKFTNLIGVNGFPLRFDFGIYTGNSTPDLFIEYDGEYHYYPISGEEQLLITKHHDSLKNKYIKDNGYDLLRIPYYQKDNIKILIDNYLEGKL